MSLLWQESNRHPVVDERDFKRFLRYPPARAFDGPLAENALWARTWFAAHARPWCCVVGVDETLRLQLKEHFPHEEKLAIIAASAGPEPEAEAAARWAAGEPDRYYFLECLAAATVETLLAEARGRLGADRHQCPGYPHWSISDNRLLLEALQQAVALPGPLGVLASGMLTPKKSQLAVCALHTVPVPAP